MSARRLRLSCPAGTAEAVEPVVHEALQEVDMARQLVLVIDDEEPVRDAVTDILGFGRTGGA